MRLDEFIESSPLTSEQQQRLRPITEVEIGPDQPIGLLNSNILDQLKPLAGDIEGYLLYGLRFGNQIVFAIKNATELVLSILVVEDFDILDGDEKKAVQVKRSWTPEEFRNKGFSTALYDGLTRHGYRIVSDTQLSHTALRVWDKLKSKRNVRFFDLSTNQYTDKNPVTDNGVVFVLENLLHKKSAIMEDTKLFTVWHGECP